MVLGFLSLRIVGTKFPKRSVVLVTTGNELNDDLPVERTEFRPGACSRRDHDPSRAIPEPPSRCFPVTFTRPTITSTMSTSQDTLLVYLIPHSLRLLLLAINLPVSRTRSPSEEGVTSHSLSARYQLAISLLSACYQHGCTSAARLPSDIIRGQGNNWYQPPTAPPGPSTRPPGHPSTPPSLYTPISLVSDL